MNPVTALSAYLRGVSFEVQKVSWPTWPLVLRYFISLVAGIALATAFVGGLDYIFLKALSFAVNKQP